MSDFARSRWLGSKVLHIKRRTRDERAACGQVVYLPTEDALRRRLCAKCERLVPAARR